MLAETTEQQIVAWLKAYLADLLSLQVEDIDIHASFSRLGLDSSAGIAMTGELSQWLSCELDPTVVFDYPSIAALSAMLAGDSKVQQQRPSLHPSQI